MSDKNDKTVPVEADDYKDDEKQSGTDRDRRPENDPLVRAAKSKPGEPPNRDEDEFSDEGLEEPDVKNQAEKEAEEVTDES